MMVKRSPSMLMPFAQRAFAIDVGSKLPSALVSVVKHDGEGWKNEIVDTNEYLANKTVVVVGYPGAFTPTCMQQHIPGYIENASQIKSGGADEIIAMSVNDPFVVTAFAEKLDGKQLVNYMADGNGEFTKALGLDFDLSAVQLGNVRAKRFSMIVKNNSIVHFNNEDGPKATEISDAKTIIGQISK